MWHMIPVSTIEQFEFMNLVFRGTEREALELAQRLAEAASAGVGQPPVVVEKAEIYAVWNEGHRSKTLYLNDAALRVYLRLGGLKVVSGTVSEAPTRRPGDVFGPSCLLSTDVYARS